jgi:uncharacterized LabA/DUF88 family protein
LTDNTRLKIAVFIDFDNIEIGVKTTLGGQFDVGVVLDALKERGEVVSKIAYGDWKRAGDHSRLLTQHAIKMVQRNLTPGGDKNGADINLALDALEMAFTHAHINAYVIVGGDSDFITLVEKLKQYDKKVFVVGGRSFTSQVMQRNCNEFISYENLIGTSGRRTVDRTRAASSQPAHAASSATAPIAQAMPLVRRALKLLADREVSAQLGLLKSTLLQLDSTFSERSYGTGTFRDFAEKLAAAGYVTLKHAGRSIHVELPDGDAHETETRQAEPQSVAAPVEAEIVPEPRAAEGEASRAPSVPGTPQPVGTPDLARVRDLFARATTSPRWPMYLRNVRQYLRSVDPGFDERAYGFAGLMDLVRAGQREGLFRVERDRRGALRVFAGPMLPQSTGLPADAQAPEFVEAEPLGVAEDVHEMDSEPFETTQAGDIDAAAVIETTAEPMAGQPGADAEAEPAKPARRRKAAAPKAGARKAATPRARKTPGARTRRTPTVV